MSRTGLSLPEGHVGAVALETPSRMSYFLGDSRETRKTMYGDLVRTGDLGYMRGEELFWVGRVRERITVRGKKYDPSYFEEPLLKIFGVRHGWFAAFGVDDEHLGTQRVVIVIEIRDSNERSLQEISEDIRKQVYFHLGLHIPDIVLVREGTLTKTSSGKRRHRYFRQLYMEGKLKDLELGPDKSIL